MQNVKYLKKELILSFILNDLFFYNFKTSIFFKWKIFNKNDFFVFQHFGQFAVEVIARYR